MRRQCRRFEFQRILLPVRMRIHWGMGRFWAIFLASVRFVRKVLCDGCGGARRVRVAVASLSRGACVQRVRPALCGVGRFADPRWGRRDATTGGAFGVGRSAGPPLRSFAVPAGVRNFCAMTQRFVCLAVGPGTARARAKGRAAAYEAMELRLARAR